MELPKPETNAEFFLAALVNKLDDLRLDLRSLHVELKDRASTPPSGQIDLRETVPPKPLAPPLRDYKEGQIPKKR